MAVDSGSIRKKRWWWAARRSGRGSKT